QTVDRAAAVTTFAAGERRDEFKGVVDALNRVSNLAAKASSKEVQPALFVEESEGALYEAWKSASGGISSSLQSGDAAGALAKLAELKSPINTYFDRVRVM